MAFQREDKEPEKRWFDKVLDATVETAESATKMAGDAMGEVKDGYIQNTMINTLRSSALTLAEVTAEIDKELKDRDSPYEVAFYRVSGNVGVIAGINFDIHFTKSPTAKEESEFVIIINPKTDSQLRVPRKALIGRERAKIRDPETGEILTIDVKTRRIVS